MFVLELAYLISKLPIPQEYKIIMWYIIRNAIYRKIFFNLKKECDSYNMFVGYG